MSGVQVPSPPPSSASLLATLERYLGADGLVAGDLLLVAFSGGPDSTALLWGLSRLVGRRSLRLHAAHLDHGLDAASAARAVHAASLAAALDVPLTTERREVARQRRAGESIEVAARRVRYDWLADVAAARGAVRTLTAHHRDDQAETVLLRLDRGSGLAGLAGIPSANGLLRRPLLALSREELVAALAPTGLGPSDDPTNRDLAQPRNRVRHGLLTHLARRDDLTGSELAARLASLATAAGRARDALDRWLGDHLLTRADAAGASLAAERLVGLPDELIPFALGLLQRLAGAPYPPSQRARDELARQLAAARGGRRRVGGAAGGGWHWTLADGRLCLTTHRPRIPAPGFTYTFAVPGDLVPPTAAFRFRLSRQAPAPWMWRQDDRPPLRAALALPIADGDRVEVRSRRPGDRLQPLGSDRPRDLRHLLINRRVPRETRDHLPLLVVSVPGAGETIAWVPGVTVNERFRLPPPSSNDPAVPLAWVAEVLAP